MNTAAEFAVIYGTERYHMFGILLRIVGNPDIAEDLAGQLWLRAWAAWPRYQADVPVGAWLSTIARRLAIDWFRSAPTRARAQPAPAWWEPVAPDNPAADVELREECAQAHRLISWLTPRRRTIVLMVAAGFSYREIGQHLGLTEGTVKINAFRARGQCRAWAAAEAA